MGISWKLIEVSVVALHVKVEVLLPGGNPAVVESGHSASSKKLDDYHGFFGLANI